MPATNGSARRNASTGSGRRTGVSACAANVPRNVVWKRKYMNTAKNPTCDARRIHTSTRITLRAGMPLPGRLGPCFFGFAGAAGCASAVEAGAALSVGVAVPVGVEAPVGVEVEVPVGVAVEVPVGVEVEIGLASSAGTAPGLPVFHGMGSG